MNSKTISALIPKCAENIRSTVAAEVKAKLVCLKVDLTSTNNRHFLGINVQYIKTGKVTVRTLGVVELFCRHTSLNIKAEVLRILHLYGIYIDNIITFTTDNGTNMLKAAQLLQEDDPAQREEVQVLEDMDDDALPECELPAKHTLQSIRCAAHTLQLAVDDAVKATPSLKWQELLDQARNLAKYLRTPTVARQVKREGHPLPSLDVKTRWGSSYDMLRSIKDMKSFIADMFTEDQQKYDLSSDQWGALDDALAALEPVRLTTIALQEERLLLGDFFALWMKCKIRLQHLAERSDNPLAQHLQMSMEKRERGQLYKTGREKCTPLFEYPGFKAALFLDPRYFSFLEGDDVESAKVYLLHLWERILKLRRSQHAESCNDDNTALCDGNDNNNILSSASEDEDDDLKHILSLKDSERYTSTAIRSKVNIRLVLDNYFTGTKRLKAKTDVVQYWEDQRFRQPDLYELSSAVLAIPATQVSVERLFSSLKYVLNPLRYKLSAENIDGIMLLHSNHDMLQECLLPGNNKDSSELLADSSSSTFMDQTSFESTNSSSDPAK